MRKSRMISLALVLALLMGALAGCGGSIVDDVTNSSNPGNTQQPGNTAQPGNSQQPTEPAVGDKTDLTEHLTLKINFTTGNKDRVLTYFKESPMTLPNGDVVTAGMLKPVWTQVASALNIDIQDVTIQDQKASEMMQTASTDAFAGANIFGGNSVATDFMNYGSRGMFVNLVDMMDQGYMPNFARYLQDNPSIKSAITAYDGGIYYVPYIAEINTFARAFVARETWVTDLLDAAGANYDTAAYTTYYDGFLIGSNARTGSNGGSVIPKAGVTITKKTSQNIIEIQNALATKNGKTLTEALITYINDNYDYSTPSELYLGEKAAYDIDELVALMRCIKANPGYLTGGKADVVWPFFVRQSSYREDLLRLGTYFDGVKAHGADSYGSRWYIDENNTVQYTYTTEGMYDVLNYLSDMEAEGLFYADTYDLNNKTNFRSKLWGTDASDAPAYGWMTYDWIASSTTDDLNPDTVVMLPPVANVNGAWQYYIDNGRAIKSDGWAISVKGNASDAELHRSCALLDYFFTEEGDQLQNYGMDMILVEGETYHGPDGIDYPKYNDWLYENLPLANGDMSTFLRDWIGSQIPIGYQKNIGFEYQYTSARGFAGWALLTNSTTGFANYEGDLGLPGGNPNYYKMIPSAFSMTDRQQEQLSTETSIEMDDSTEYLFNIIRYKTKGNAPAGVTIPASYNEYLQFFKDKGLDTYVSVYQASYAIMTAGN